MAPLSPKERLTMTSTESQAILDAFYKPDFILMRERFYGKDYMSPGGEAAGKELLLRLALRPGERVLDIGCGTGGPATFMARHYGSHVHGLELSHNMIQLGQQRLNASEETLVKERVKLEAADATTVQLERDSYDVIYSRDTFCHIKDKMMLFENCLPALRSGGRVFISDFCRGDKEPPQEFTDYWKEKGFYISTFSEYVQPLKVAGLKNITTTDITNEIVKNIEEALKHFRATKEAFIQDFNAECYEDIDSRFTKYAEWAHQGHLLWGLFMANKE